MQSCEESIYPEFNCGVIFRTNDNSWHGVPKIIKCPEGEFRKTLAFYWLSPLITKKKEEMYRKKAKFVPVPGQKNAEKFLLLCDIRAVRRITDDDMKNIWPEWCPGDEN